MSTPTASARPGAGAGAGAGAAAVQTPTTAGRRQQGAHAPSSTGAAPASAAFRTPTTGTTNAPVRRTPGTATNRTPHARAARLALDSRRTAMFTPGGRQRQSRRKSGRMLRDSPRDLLRNLSRRLAPTSQAIASSSSPGGGSSGGKSRRSDNVDMDMDTIYEGRAAQGGYSSSRRRRSYLDINDDDDDDSLPLDRPRMSLPIEEDDNDDDLRPHHSRILDNGDDADMDPDADLANFTMRSIELARRTATQEQLLQARRFSRGSLGGRGRSSSFGSMRMSDYIDGFIGGADGDDAERAQSAFFPEGAFDNLLPDNNDPAGGGADMTFERLDDSEAGGRQDALAAGRESGMFGVIDVPLDANETTFMIGQQSPDRTLGPVLEADDGEEQELPPPEADVGGAMFEDYEDYRDENNGNMWQDEPDNDEEQDEVAEEVVAVTADDAAAKDAAQAALIRSAREQGKKGPRANRLKLSAHGIPYPSLPAGVVKRVAQTFAQQSTGAGKKTKLSPETVAALSTASDWFFEQVGVDLQRYAKHAGRKTIDESDMLLLMRRQRQVNATVTPFSLAQRLLPRELLQELRMIPDAPMLKRRQQQQQQRPQRISSGPKRIGKKRGKDVT